MLAATYRKAVIASVLALIALAVLVSSTPPAAVRAADCDAPDLRSLKRKGGDVVLKIYPDDSAGCWPVIAEIRYGDSSSANDHRLRVAFTNTKLRVDVREFEIGGTVHVKVRILDEEGGRSRWSDSRRVRLPSREPPPPPRISISPSEYKSRAGRLQVSWSGGGEAEKYEVQVFAEERFLDGDRTREREKSYELDMSASYHKVRVRGITDSNFSEWSEFAYSFRVDDPPPPPSPTAPSVAKLAPVADEVSIDVGDSIAFSVRGADADGDLASIEWLIDWTSVARSQAPAHARASWEDSLAHAFHQAGQRNVDVIVRDATGRVASASWTVIAAEPETDDGGEGETDDGGDGETGDQGDEPPTTTGNEGGDGGDSDANDVDDKLREAAQGAFADGSSDGFDEAFDAAIERGDGDSLIRQVRRTFSEAGFTGDEREATRLIVMGSFCRQLCVELDISGSESVWYAIGQSFGSVVPVAASAAVRDLLACGVADLLRDGCDPEELVANSIALLIDYAPVGTLIKEAIRDVDDAMWTAAINILQIEGVDHFDSAFDALIERGLGEDLLHAIEKVSEEAGIQVEPAKAVRLLVLGAILGEVGFQFEMTEADSVWYMLGYVVVGAVPLIDIPADIRDALVCVASKLLDGECSTGDLIINVLAIAPWYLLSAAGPPGIAVGGAAEFTTEAAQAARKLDKLRRRAPEKANVVLRLLPKWARMWVLPLLFPGEINTLRNFPNHPEAKMGFRNERAKELMNDIVMAKDKPRRVVDILEDLAKEDPADVWLDERNRDWKFVESIRDGSKSGQGVVAEIDVYKSLDVRDDARRRSKDHSCVPFKPFKFGVDGAKKVDGVKMVDFLVPLGCDRTENTHVEVYRRGASSRSWYSFADTIVNQKADQVKNTLKTDPYGVGVVVADARAHRIDSLPGEGDVSKRLDNHFADALRRARAKHKGYPLTAIHVVYQEQKRELGVTYYWDEDAHAVFKKTPMPETPWEWGNFADGEMVVKQ